MTAIDDRATDPASFYATLTAEERHDLQIHNDGYAAGYLAAQEAAGVSDCEVPVPTRWRWVQPGDTIRGPDRRKWMIRTISATRDGRVHVIAVHGLKVLERPTAQEPALDPDAEVLVLEPVPMEQAVRTVRSQLNAQILARRVEGETP